MVFHPCQQVGLHFLETTDAVLQQGRSHHSHPSAGHHPLEHLVARVDAARHRQVQTNLPIKDSDPVQSEQKFVRLAEDKIGNHLQVFQVKVRLVESVEQHQGCGPLPL